MVNLDFSPFKFLQKKGERGALGTPGHVNFSGGNNNRLTGRDDHHLLIISFGLFLRWDAFVFSFLENIKKLAKDEPLVVVLHVAEVIINSLESLNGGASKKINS